MGDRSWVTKCAGSGSGPLVFFGIASLIHGSASPHPTIKNIVPEFSYFSNLA